MFVLLLGRNVFGERRNAVHVIQAPTGGRSEKKIKLGVVLGFDGLWGKTSTSDVLARGLGYSGGLSVQTRLGDLYRGYFATSYQYLRLGRPFDSSGQLQEPSPANVDQSMKTVGFTLLASYLIERGQEATAPFWWIDFGGEYLLPLSAQQTVSGSTSSFTAGKGLLALFGATAEFQMNANYDVTASLQGIYNLAGSSDSRFFGLRVLGGVTMRI